MATPATMALVDARGIDHVGIRYRDLPRAVAGFRDVLGFEDPEGTVFHFMPAKPA
jgi:catechol 2,3-dioxygenase-like lactoylglutathione lyase family enzyme